MTDDEKKFMAAQGLLQWLAAAVMQGKRLSAIYKSEMPRLGQLSSTERNLLVLRSHTEGNFLANAAKHVIEYRNWTTALGLFASVDFSALDSFDQKAITDLRNMREHMIDYFEGRGGAQDQWFVETPEFSADASSVVGPLLGGRLDYQAYTATCEVVLQDVMAHSDSGIAV